VDPREPDLMRRRPRRAGAGILTWRVTVLLLLGGAWSAFVNVMVFAWALGHGRPLEEAMTMTFVSLVLIQFLKAYVFRSESHSILRAPFANRWLDRAVLWEVALLGGILYIPALAAPFRAYPLPLYDWLVLLPSALTIVPVLEIAKWIQRTKRHGSSA
jgi:Ca2+-transporting ATPase